MRFCFAVLYLICGMALTSWGEELTTLTEPIHVFEVRTDKVDCSIYRVRFCVRNNDDKSREITAKAGALGLKRFTIPAYSSKSCLEVKSNTIKPTCLTVSSGSYSTNQLLRW